MGLLTSEDKEYIKRALPKSSNKVIDVAIARLYIAYPNPNEWQYTGLSGAVALVDDLVGHTFFLKLVDIKGHNGVLWDQELYVNFEYYQDRTFFHSFEMEECFAGLLFDDLGEASHFLKRVQKRERYASKKTLSNKNAIALTKKVNEEQANEVVHGPRGESLMGHQRERYNYDNVVSIPATKTKAPPPPPPMVGAAASSSESDNNDDYNSDWASAPSAPTTPAPQIPGVSAPEVPTQAPVRHAVPPLPAQFAPPQGQVPQRQASQEQATPVSPNPQSPQQPQGAHKKDNPFPFPIPQSSAPNGNNPFPFPVPQQLPSAQNTPFPIPGVAPFQSPPSNNRPLPALPNRNARPVPAPPNRNITTGARNVPPVPPSRRGPAPPPPPHRNTGAHAPTNFVYSQNTGSNAGRPPAPPPPRRGPAPPPPPRSSRVSQFPRQSPFPQPQAPGYYNNTASQQPQPPTFPAPQQQFQAPQQQFQAPQQQFQAPPPPPTPPTTFNNIPAVNGASAPSAPPPPPSFLTQPQASAPPPPPSFLTQPQASGPPAPPSLPQTSNSTFVESSGDSGRDALLASIRGAGIGGLRKVDKAQLDRPSVLLQEAHGQTPQPASSGGPAPAGGAPSSLADALAAALNKRKTKVGSGDFDDGDDW